MGDFINGKNSRPLLFLVNYKEVCQTNVTGRNKWSKRQARLYRYTNSFSSVSNLVVSNGLARKASAPTSSTLSFALG
jgi:hypothetical protein